MLHRMYGRLVHDVFHVSGHERLVVRGAGVVQAALDDAPSKRVQIGLQAGAKVLDEETAQDLRARVVPVRPHFGLGLHLQDQFAIEAPSMRMNLGV
jgi:hypothetical protein